MVEYLVMNHNKMHMEEYHWQSNLVDKHLVYRIIVEREELLVVVENDENVEMVEQKDLMLEVR